MLRRKALRNGKNASQYAPSGTQDTTDHRQAARTQAKPALTVTAVRPQSPAAAQGVLPGDTVISMNNQPINNRKDYDSTRQKANGKPVTLVLQRGEKQRSYQVPPIAWGLSLGTLQDLSLALSLQDVRLGSFTWNISGPFA